MKKQYLFVAIMLGALVSGSALAGERNWRIHQPTDQETQGFYKKKQFQSQDHQWRNQAPSHSYRQERGHNHSYGYGNNRSYSYNDGHHHHKRHYKKHRHQHRHMHGPHYDYRVMYGPGHYHGNRYCNIKHATYPIWSRPVVQVDYFDWY